MRRHRLSRAGVELRVRRARENEQGRTAVPLLQEALGHLAVARQGVLWRRVWIESDGACV
ncbi:MAG: hypothetical protein ACRDNE_08115 [Gaiellaceae bacterium]